MRDSKGTIADQLEGVRSSQRPGQDCTLVDFQATKPCKFTLKGNVHSKVPRSLSCRDVRSILRL